MKERENRRLKPLRLGLLTLALVSCFGYTAFAQTMKITGVVKEAGGGPMPGVTILVEGTSRGTTTNGNGEFEISANKGQVLHFEFMGYETEVVPLDAQTRLDITLQEGAVKIDDVVVLGYGANVAKRDVIGAVTSMSEEDIIAKAPVNIFDALRGEMAGVQISSTSGAPGAAVNVRVRGVSTFEENGVSPLYIVDGIILDDISNINPNDIQSLDVLKDAASAAIYGARAANGVIIVTTKMAKAGGAPRVDLRFIQTFGYLSNKLPQLNRKQADLFTGRTMGFNNKDQFQWFGDTADSCSLASMTANDYQDLISQVAKRTDINLSISGGSEKMKFYTSGGYVKETGIILSSQNDRFNFRNKIDYQAYDFLKIISNISFTYTKNNAVNEGSIFYNTLRRMPQTALYYPAGGAWLPAWNHYPNTGKRNPMIEIYGREDEAKRYQANIMQAFEFTLMPNLLLTVRGTANYYYQDREQYSSPWTQTNYARYSEGVSDMTSATTFYENLVGETFLNYFKTFGDHHVTAMLGGSLETRDTRITTLKGKFLLTDEIRVPQATTEPGIPQVTGRGNSFASMFGRVDYNYKGRYLFSATLRRDGSSRFGPNNRWGNFPAVQAGWRFSDHFQGTRLHNILSDAKFRASWGRTGNDQIGDYDSQTLYQASKTNGYKDLLGVSTMDKLGNTYLKWEETTSTNLGLDLLFLGGRFTLTADVYKNKTKDLLDDESMPTELGYTTMRVNVGSIENKGVEIAVGGYVIEKRDWSWYTQVTWAGNKNKVLSISGEGGRPVNANWWVEPGKAAGQFYGFKNNGVYAYDESNAYTPDFKERLLPVFQRDGYGNVMFNENKKPTVTGYTHLDGSAWSGNASDVKKMTIVGNTLAQGGDVIWDDADQNGIINDLDRQLLGSGYNDWFGGWTNNVQWKNFALNFSFVFSKGGYIYNKLLYDLSRYGDSSSAPDPRSLIYGWRFQGQQTGWFVPGNKTREAGSNDREISSFFLEDASYIKLQNVRLSYQFDKRIAKKLYVNSLQVYIFGNNLLTWTNYRGYDPDISSGGVLNPGQDNQRYPKKREIGFGINIGF